MTLPKQIPVKRMDDLYSEFVGVAGQDGIQFWHLEWTSAVSARTGIESVLFWFDEQGGLLDFRPCPITDEISSRSRDILRFITAQLGSLRLCDIRVRPFEVQIAGEQFGLIASKDGSSASIQPGALLMFQEPWDGEYYT